jgi:tRNA (cytidine/uridine-2'-O-)-methyltransferase
MADMGFPSLSLALYQPDIPQNVGAAIRLCACLNVPLEIIEPCGFLWDPRKVRQSALDYYDRLQPTLHQSWGDFLDLYQGRRRIILLTTKASAPYCGFRFESGDILLAGRESVGAPEEVHQAASARITVPMAEGLRALNMVNACAMVLGEALRQTRWS